MGPCPLPRFAEELTMTRHMTHISACLPTVILFQEQLDVWDIPGSPVTVREDEKGMESREKGIERETVGVKKGEKSLESPLGLLYTLGCLPGIHMIEKEREKERWRGK